MSNCTRVRKAMEGIKHDDGKLDWALLPIDEIEEIIRVYMRGAKKYGKDNWRNGFEYSRLYSAILRHLTAWFRGKDIDDDAQTHQLANVCWSCLTLMWMQRNKSLDFDDRPKSE